MIPSLCEVCLLRCRKSQVLCKKAARDLLQKKIFLRHDRSLAYSATSRHDDCHYDVLSIKKTASQAEVKAAFVKKSKEMHPDRNPGDPSMHEQFVRLNEAYTVLGRPSSRREYDFSLAARLAHQQNLRQQFGSHWADSAQAGSGTYQSAETEKPFWDETIFDMRDKSQDANRFNSDDMYYGVRGVHRFPNSYILFGCFIIMGVGFLLHLAALQYSKQVNSFMDERDRKAHAHLARVRKRALKHGNAKQLELLKNKVEDRQGDQPINSPP